ncbi:MAG: hypothetical protein KF767_09385 [Bdellovibrionaceae bacterium]|nr:hypothetical protein [Pseudobdellovibrionaceae bacterium]
MLTVLITSAFSGANWFAYFNETEDRLNVSHADDQLTGMSCLTATNYFLPRAEDFRCRDQDKITVRLGGPKSKATARICPSAKAEAVMQGSLQIVRGEQRYIYRYNGSSERVNSGCATTTGAAGVCLTPYIHVAADPRHHRMGDILRIPQLKGVLVPHPDGGLMPHPGYVIVADTGGAIKGENRFDFFIGEMAWDSPRNPFGPAGLAMTDDRHCILGFKKIRGDSSMAGYVQAGINELLKSPSTQERLAGN